MLTQTRQATDEEYARLVKEWTTSSEFMSPLVDHLPKVAGVPSPKDVLGYYIGCPQETYPYGGDREILPGPGGRVQAREGAHRRHDG